MLLYTGWSHDSLRNACLPYVHVTQSVKKMTAWKYAFACLVSVALLFLLDNGVDAQEGRLKGLLIYFQRGVILQKESYIKCSSSLV